MAKILDRPIVPSESETVEARKSFEALKKDPSNTHFILGSQTGQQIPLTENAFNYLLAILSEMAKGNALLVVPVQAELSTYDAAELLGRLSPICNSPTREGRTSFPSGSADTGEFLAKS